MEQMGNHTCLLYWVSWFINNLNKISKKSVFAKTEDAILKCLVLPNSRTIFEFNTILGFLSKLFDSFEISSNLYSTEDFVINHKSLNTSKLSELPLTQIAYSCTCGKSHILWFLNYEIVFSLKMKLFLKKKQRRNRMRRMRKMKSLVAYGSNQREEIALLCGWLTQAVKEGIFLKR